MKGLDSLSLRLMSQNESCLRYGGKVDLYDDDSMEKYCNKASRKLGLDAMEMQLDLNKLSDLMEAYRLELIEEKQRLKQAGRKDRSRKLLQKREKEQALKLLKTSNLLEKLNELIGQAGVVGEERNRLLLLLCSLSYKTESPLHVLIQGSSGSGKTLLLRKIAKMIPEEDRFVYTSLTPMNLYYRGDELKHAFLAIEDYDGLPEDARYALRELQTGDGLRRGSSQQGEDGETQSRDIVSKGPIASVMCTTHGEIYEDNMNRCFLLIVDESEQQTNKILNYQAAKRRGEINKNRELEVLEQLQNMSRLLRKMQLINPFAGKVNLPKDIPNQRRLNDLFLNLINLIAWLHQYQRTQDSLGRIVATVEDLKSACSLLLGTFIQKSDDLNSKLRKFFERLKKYVLEQGGETYRFSRQEVRLALRISRTAQHRLFEELEDLEYIRQAGGSKFRGYQYEIVYWDDYELIKSKIAESIQAQLHHLEV
jgi:energy-coupling factor transporter ATP-binding protein EcfA2